MTIQARRNCPGLPGLPVRAKGIHLLRADLLLYIRPWFNAFKTFKSFKSILDSSQRLERFERSAAIERLEPGISLYSEEAMLTEPPWCPARAYI